MSWKPQVSRQALGKTLEARAKLNQQIRSFFQARNVLEVETPILNSYTVTDQQIESIATEQNAFLHTSPEYAMKKLLVCHQQDIFQICKVFRAEEQGRYHRQEFTMLEWYRVSWTYHDLMQEVAELISHALVTIDLQESVFIPYQQAFKQYAGIDILHADQADYLQVCNDHGINLHTSLTSQQFQEILLDQVIVQKFASDRIYFIFDYPKQQAALAKINSQGLAERFECYLNGIELANGFQELTDANQQRARFEEDNRNRLLANKSAVEIDEHFLAALEDGLPESAGVALGVDRLLMLLLGATHIDEVLFLPK